MYAPWGTTAFRAVEGLRGPWSLARAVLRGAAITHRKETGSFSRAVAIGSRQLRCLGEQPVSGRPGTLSLDGKARASDSESILLGDEIDSDCNWCLGSEPL